MNNILVTNKTSVMPYSNDPKRAMAFNDGDSFTAVLEKRTDEKLHFRTSYGDEFIAKPGDFSINEGDTVKFQAFKGKDNAISLKYIENLTQKSTPQNGATLSSSNVMELFKQNNFIKDENIHEIESPAEYSKPSKEEELAIAKIKSKIAYADGNLSQSVINELLASGVSISDLTLDMMNGVLQKVQESPENISQENYIKSIEKYSNEINKYKQMSKEDFSIAKELVTQNLPVNDANIEHVKKAINALNDVKDMPDSAIIEILKSNGNTTLKDVYHAKYASSEASTISNENWESLQNEVKRIFEKEGIELNDENLDKAKLLIGNDIPVSKNNITRMDFYKNISSKDLSDIIKSSVQGIKKGVNPLDMPLSPQGLENEDLAITYEEISNSLSKINESTLAFAERANIPLTLYNLRNLALSGESFEPAQSSVTSKLMLAEIQLKLTSEVSYSLMQKGINIDTLPLEKTIEALRLAETENYKEALVSVGEETTVTNVSKMDEIYTAINNTRILTNNVFSDIMQKATPFTITGVGNSVKHARLMESMESFMTVPSAKYGDSFAKVLDKFSSVLSRIGIEETEENIRAATILSRANMDVTEENILQIKIIDSKLDGIHNRLHPEIAANMVKDGINPLDMHVDDVLQYINNHNKDYGNDLGSKIAEFIYQMDNDKSIPKENRDALINIYKALNNIEKYGSAALGVNLKSGSAPTLRNLLDASDYYKKTRANSVYSDIKVDDNFGSLEKINNENSIRTILANTNQAVNDNNLNLAEDVLSVTGDLSENSLNKAVYNKDLVSKISDLLTPSSFAKLLEKEDYLNLSLEDTLKEIDKPVDIIPTNVSQSEVTNSYNEVKALLHTDPSILREMETLAIPLTFSNIRAFKLVSDNDSFTADKLDEIEASLNNIDLIEDGDFHEGDMDYDKTMDTIHDKLNDIVLDNDNIKNDFVKEIILLQNAIKVQSAVSKRTNNYNIPVKINGDIRNLNIYVPNGSINDENVNIAISLKTKDGNLDLVAKSSNNNLEILVNEDAFYDDLLNRTKNDLVGHINEAGFKVTYINNENVEELNKSISQLPSNKERIFELGSKITKYIDYVENL